MSLPTPTPGNIGQWAIILVIVVAIVAVVWVAINAFGIPIPGFIVTIFWILLATFVVVAAIKFLMRM